MIQTWQSCPSWLLQPHPLSCLPLLILLQLHLPLTLPQAPSTLLRRVSACAVRLAWKLSPTYQHDSLISPTSLPKVILPDWPSLASWTKLTPPLLLVSLPCLIFLLGSHHHLTNHVYLYMFFICIPPFHTLNGSSLRTERENLFCSDCILNR